MKKFILPAATLLAILPAAAHAEEVRRFEHEGHTYSYTIKALGDRRIITGIDEKTRKPFTLRVGTHKVRGIVGSQQVEFSLKDVEPLTKPVTTLAAR